MSDQPTRATDSSIQSALPRRIVESLSAIVVVVDTAKRVMIFNPSAERLTGCRAGDVRGKPLAEVHAIFESLEKRNVIDRTLQLGVPSEIKDIEVDRPEGGRPLYFDLICDPLVDEDGAISGAAIMAVDVSELVRLRTHLARQNEDLVVLHQVSNVLRATMDVDKALFIICTALTSVGMEGNDHAMVFLASEDRRFLRGAVATGRYDSRVIWRVWQDLITPQHSRDGVLEANYPRIFRRTRRLSRVVEKITVPVEDASLLLAEVVRERRTMTNHDVEASGGALAVHRPLSAKFRMTSFCALPLSVHGEVIGVMIANSSRHPREYKDHGVKILEMFADQAALAINNGTLYRRVAERAQRDSLTQLFNHGHFQSRLADELMRAQRYNDNVSLLMFDIDHFKVFNDTYGHQTGDAVLVSLGAFLQHTLRATDIAARYGGEEFVVVLPHTEREHALALAERLRAQIAGAALASHEGRPLHVTVSVGVSCFPADAQSPSDLVHAADKALYAAKRMGRDRVVSADVVRHVPTAKLNFAAEKK